MQSRRNDRIDKKKCHFISVSFYRRYRASVILLAKRPNHKSLRSNSRRTRNK